MKRHLLFILVALLPVVARAYTPGDYYTLPGYDFKIDGIFYKFSTSSEDEVLVSYELLKYVSYWNQNGEFNESIDYISDYSGDVVIPESVTYNDKTYRVTSIGDNAFYGCRGMTSITIPESINSIGRSAFRSCTGLSFITIPSSVKLIIVYAFEDCSGLKDIYCNATEVPTVRYGAFDSCPISSIIVHVPEGSEDLYRETEPWSDFGSIVPMTVEINETSFPDSWFRNWMLNETVGTDGVLTNEEMASVKEICFDSTMNDQCGTIESLKGIEYFTELTKLQCGGLMLRELDMSRNTRLRELVCHDNELLTKLDVSNRTALKILDCHNNPNLAEINISGTKNLTSLNVSGCSALTSLDCTNRKLTELDVSGCTALQELDCSGNVLTSLDVSGCTELIKLQYWKNKIKAPEMEDLIESLPVTNTGRLYAIYNRGGNHDQNVMTTLQVAAAQAKGWVVRSYNHPNMEDYVGSEPTEIVSFTEGQMATIILPRAPKAEWGRYYRLDRCEDNYIVFVEEQQPQAHTPYIIVPNKDFCVDIGAQNLAGLSNEGVSIEGVSFIGSYVHQEFFGVHEDYYIDLIDTTEDCHSDTRWVTVIGALRAYLQVNWDNPINTDGMAGSNKKKEVVLLDEGDGIGGPSPDPSLYGGEIYNLAGQCVTPHRGGDGRGLPRGIYIVDGKKVAIK